MQRETDEEEDEGERKTINCKQRAIDTYIQRERVIERESVCVKYRKRQIQADENQERFCAGNQIAFAQWMISMKR